MLQDINTIDIRQISDSNIFPQFIQKATYSNSIKVSKGFFTILSEALKTNRSLTHLILRDVFIPISLEDGSADPYVVLARGLEGNTTLRHLDLSENIISEEGLAAIAFALRNNTTLLSLDLHGNKITVHDAKPLNQYFHLNHILYAYYNSMSKDVAQLLNDRQLYIKTLIAGYQSGAKYISDAFIPLLKNQEAILYVSNKERLFDINSITEFKYNMNAAVIACTFTMSPTFSTLPKELMFQILELSGTQGQQNLQKAIGI